MDHYVVLIGNIGRPGGRPTSLSILLGSAGNDASYGVVVAADKGIISRDFRHNRYTLRRNTALKVVEAGIFGCGIRERRTHTSDISAQMLEKVASLLGVVPTDVA